MISKFTSLKLGLVASALILGSCGSSTGNGEGTSATQSQGTEQSNDFVSIFNGENLDGWDGDAAYWRVEDGTIVGEVTPENPLKNNTFLIWQGGELADFELKGEFKITEAGNSGVQYRSDLFTEVPYALRGYQADIDGRSRSICPHESGSARQLWLNGWRESRIDQWDGLNRMAQVQKLSNIQQLPMST